MALADDFGLVAVDAVGRRVAGGQRACRTYSQPTMGLPPAKRAPSTFFLSAPELSRSGG